jgi:glycerophosphoryl diester phosphodiesterase
MSDSFTFDGPAEIIAHRGFSTRAPENTLAAIDLGIEAGADAVEFDLHTAADGSPVVFHDAMLSRTTNGVGPVRRRTLGQIQMLDAGSWFSADFAGERVPSFAEALERIGDRVGRVYAEVKGFRELEDVDRMVRIAADAGAADRVVFIAMNWTLLDRMRSQDPTLRVGYIVDDPETLEVALGRAEGDAHALLDFRADLLMEPGVAERVRERGIPMAAWTINEPEQASMLLEAGVPRITTNEVEALVAWKRGL